MAGKGSAPGERRGGRQKGVPNKITADLRAAILGAFKAVGGKAYLAGIAKSQPAVFCQLLGKILPMEHTGPNGGPIEVITGVPQAPE